MANSTWTYAQVEQLAQKRCKEVGLMYPSDAAKFALEIAELCIEGERQRTLDALKKVERFVRAHNDFELYLHQSKPFWDLLAELKQLTNK